MIKIWKVKELLKEGKLNELIEYIDLSDSPIIQGEKILEQHKSHLVKHINSMLGDRIKNGLSVREVVSRGITINEISKEEYVDP